MLDAKMEQLNFGTYMESYTLPSLNVEMCPKEAKASIVTVQFSCKGDYLAISYNNEYKLSDQLAAAENADSNPLAYQ